MGPQRLDIGDRVEAEARRLGFSLYGVVDADPSEHMRFYKDWLRAERHGEMAYLEREDAVERRADLSQTMASTRSVIVVGHEYMPESENEAVDPSRAIVARYARGLDYHEVVKDRLENLLRWMCDEVGHEVEGRVYVDTGPILERDLARRAGLGWFGRNTLLIDPERGSYFVLGVLLLGASLPASEPFREDRCGTCQACLDACPTGALLGRDPDGAPVIDARRCISYLTIELRGSIPEALRPAMGNRVFGCDICQEVCPWNQKFAAVTEEAGYLAKEGRDGPSLIAFTERLLDMSEKGYQREFADSPLARPRRKGMLRNLCVALGNWLSVDPEGASVAIPVLERALLDPQPLVREHAEWALSRLSRTS